MGLLGCGTVGSGVLRLLAARAEEAAARIGVPVVVERVLVRDGAKARAGELDPGRITLDPSAIVDDPAIAIVVEVMGGTGLAGELAARALASGKALVTANKALLAARGPELLTLARAQRVDLAFEAAVGGGIPIVRTLRDALAGDRVTEIVGILNGTSNYVLSRMAEAGAGFREALAEAQALGYAEADPTLDVGGHDAAQKLLVLAMLAFGLPPPAEGVLVEGIDRVDAIDVAMAARLGYALKPIVVGRDRGDRVELRAHPALVRTSSVFANVSGVLNAVRLEGAAVGTSLLSGRGAGEGPTAVSVVADVLDVARGLVAGVPGLVTGLRPLEPRPLVEADAIVARHYVRVRVVDEPGVMATVARAMADRRVSLSQIVQTEAKDGLADVVLVTHAAPWGEVATALATIARSGVLRAEAVVLRIEDDA